VIEGAGSQVTVDSKNTQPQTELTKTAVGNGETVALVNRSGNEDVVLQISGKLIESGFVIATTSSEVGVVEERTVVVYNPSVSNVAITVSRILDDALLSAFTSSASSSADIVVYLGTDVLTPG
jgi:ribosomal protein L19